MPRGQGQAEYAAALAACEEAKRRWAALQASIHNGVLDPDLVAALLASAPRGLYRHFKGGLYVVETVVYDVNGIFDPLIDYCALYGKLAGYSGTGRILYGKDAFLDPIDRKEWLGRRFVKLRNLSVLESAKLRTNARRIALGKTDEDKLRRVNLTLRP